MRRIRAGLVGITVAALLLSGCGSERPDADSWTASWESVLAAIPDRSTFTEGPDRSACAAGLAVVRTRESDLLPTPDGALDDPVRDWFRLAEDLFFECPPERGDLQGFDAAYDELDRFQLEIEAVLADIQR